MQAGVQNIHYLELNTSNYDDLYKWCEGHPSAVADRAIAQQLAAFIQTIMPSWSNATAISLSVDQASQTPSLIWANCRKLPWIVKATAAMVLQMATSML